MKACPRRLKNGRNINGDIYWENLNPTVGHEQAGLRPVLILNYNVFNKHSGTVIAVAITSQPQKAGFPLTLELEDSNLPKKSWAKINLSPFALHCKDPKFSEQKIVRCNDAGHH